MITEAERQWDAYCTSRDDWERDAQRSLASGEDETSCAACGGPLPPEAGSLDGVLCDACSDATAANDPDVEARAELAWDAWQNR
jgi:hypothetical protein